MARIGTATQPGRTGAGWGRRHRWWWVSSGVLVALLAALVGAHLAAVHRAASASPAAAGAATVMGTPGAVGRLAPDGTFTTTSGQHGSIAALRGQPTLVWFVATWCSSCQAGTQAVAQNLARLRAEHVHVVEVELYKDLGQPGASIAEFARANAGAAANSPDWTFATSSAALSYTYDPQGYLDIYYLLDSAGRIVYINGSPSATLPAVLARAARLA